MHALQLRVSRMSKQRRTNDVYQLRKITQLKNHILKEHLELYFKSREYTTMENHEGNTYSAVIRPTRVLKKMTKEDIYVEYCMMMVMIGCYVVLAVFRHMLMSLMLETDNKDVYMWVIGFGQSWGQEECDSSEKDSARVNENIQAFGTLFSFLRKMLISPEELERYRTLRDSEEISLWENEKH